MASFAVAKQIMVQRRVLSARMRSKPVPEKASAPRHCSLRSLHARMDALWPASISPCCVFSAMIVAFLFSVRRQLDSSRSCRRYNKSREERPSRFGACLAEIRFVWCRADSLAQAVNIVRLVFEVISANGLYVWCLSTCR